MRSGLFAVTATALLGLVIQTGPAAARPQDPVLEALLDSSAGLEQRIESDPDDHETRTGLAALYLEAGRPDDAVTASSAAARPRACAGAL